MNAFTAEYERCVRYYEWMLDFMNWEQAHAFPRLQLVPNASTLGLILHLMRLESSERQRMTTLLVKSAHPIALERLGDPLRVDEAREIGEALEQAQPFVDQVRAKRQRAARDDEPYQRNRLIKSLRVLLDPFFNSPPQPISNLSWRYETRVGEWIVRTQFDLSSKLLEKAVYSHNFRRSDADPKTLTEMGPFDMFEMTRPGVVQRVPKSHHGNGSLMQGAGFGACTFELLSRSDEDAMVKAVGDHVPRFWECVKEMVEGLGVAD